MLLASFGRETAQHPTSHDPQTNERRRHDDEPQKHQMRDDQIIQV